MTTMLSDTDLDTLPPAVSFKNFLLIMLVAAAGAAGAVLILPLWLPGLSTSLQGEAPKAYWYLSRASAMVAYALLWFSMALGVMITNKMARVWPGGPATFDLHQYASLLGLALALFHGLILLGDRYINYSLVQVLVPFTGASYRPEWVGLGQIGFYLFGLVGLSFYARQKISQRGWRLIHYLSFVTYLLALLHGLLSGTDSGTLWAQAIYWGTGGILLFLFIYRLLVARFKPVSQNARVTPAALAKQS